MDSNHWQTALLAIGSILLLASCLRGCLIGMRGHPPAGVDYINSRRTGRSVQVTMAAVGVHVQYEVVESAGPVHRDGVVADPNVIGLEPHNFAGPFVGFDCHVGWFQFAVQISASLIKRSPVARAVTAHPFRGLLNALLVE